MCRKRGVRERVVSCKLLIVSPYSRAKLGPDNSWSKTINSNCRG